MPRTMWNSINVVVSVFFVFLLFLGAIVGISGCTVATQDLYSAEAPPEPIQLKSLVVPETLEVSLNDPFTVQIKPFVEIDKATINTYTQFVNLADEELRPKLDLLFAIDDTASMAPHYKALGVDVLGQNMESFVAELATLKLLDYQIGIINTYDSTRYFSAVTEFSRLDIGQRNFERMGHFIPLKGIDSENRIITPDMGHKVLQDTLTVNAKSFEPRNKYSKGEPNHGNPTDNILEVEAFGPEKEEFLSPVLMAISPQSMLTGSNARAYQAFQPSALSSSGEAGSWAEYAQNYNGPFVREGAHLGIIIITDSIESGLLETAENAAIELANLKNDKNFENISTYGVFHRDAISASLRNNPKNGNLEKWSQGCQHKGDPDLSKKGSDETIIPVLESFLDKTRGNKPLGTNIVSLCSNTYGKDVVELAKDLYKRSVKDLTLTLDRIPADKLQVFYSGDENKKIPHCEKVEDERLCFITRFARGERSIVLRNQHLLNNVEVTIRYDAIDPTTATINNSESQGTK